MNGWENKSKIDDEEEDPRKDQELKKEKKTWIDMKWKLFGRMMGRILESRLPDLEDCLPGVGRAKARS